MGESRGAHPERGWYRTNAPLAQALIASETVSIRSTTFQSP